MRSQLREGDDAHSQTNGINGLNGNVETGRPSKPKYMNPHRTTMNEMKRRVAAIMGFITKCKKDMSKEIGTSTTPPSGAATMAQAFLRGVDAGMVPMNGDGASGGNFAEMSSQEMMDVLTRQLISWQQEFGRYGEK